MSDVITTKDGYMYGEWRKAINAAAVRTESIHDDSVGKKVGMRGGVVAGTVHHDLFAPVALKAFGQRWFEHGSISLFFTYALLQDEELRAIVQVPPKGTKDTQVEARLESRDGHKVAEGTISVGNPKVKSHLQAMELTNSPHEEQRILKSFEVGMEVPQNDITITRKDVEEKLPGCEDTIPWYTSNSPWGGTIVPISIVYRLAYISSQLNLQSVGFFGANEIRFVNGPVMVDVPYITKGKITAVGVTSKTEYFWHDSQIYEKKTNKLVATVRHMNRFMKAGSPLYPEVPAGK